MQMQLKQLSILILVLFFSAAILAQEKVEDRPKLGLVLSGGGARGIAEIGVLTVLEREGIIPDYITGTSIGSIVGGLYAIGYTADQLELLAKIIDWENYFNDEISRNELPIEERRDVDRYLLSFPVDSGKVQLPRGFIKGNKISLLLSRLTVPAHNIKDFNRFKIPFRCIGADFETGDAVVFKSGDLADAMRASMSIPSVFEPMEIDGKLYVDGGMIRNLPVEDVIEMGADIVIAIDIESELYKKEELKSILQVLEQSASYRIYDSKKKQTKKADIIIKPELKGFGTLDFSQVDSLLKLGKEAAEKALPRINKLLKSGRRLEKRKETPLLDKVIIADIQIINDDPTSKKTIKKILQIQKDDIIYIPEIEDKLKRLLATKFIQSAKYKLIPQGEKYILQIITQPNSGNYLRVGANYDSTLGPGLLFNATFRNSVVSGSKLTLDARVSENPALLANYILYTSTRPNIGFKLSGGVHFYPTYFYNNSILLQEFENRHYNIKLDLFSSINYRLNLSTGIGIDRYSQNEAFFDPDTEEVRLNQINLFAAINRETFDRLHFPHSGSLLQINGKYAMGGSLLKKTLDEKFDLISANAMIKFEYQKVFAIDKKFAMHWYNDAGYSVFTESNLLQLFYLGRNIPYENNTSNFFGLDYMELPAHRYAISGMKFRIEPVKDVFGSLVFNAAYFDLSEFEDEQVSMIPDEDRKGFIYGAGLELGAMTIVGPTYFTTEYNFKMRNLNFSFHLGFVF